MNPPIRIGTRESQLAVWQATQVQHLLAAQGLESSLVYINSEGDTDLHTPLYEMGVQGIFTRSLDMALLRKEIDIAVHSMKDVPTQIPTGIVAAAVLPRASCNDILVINGNEQTIWEQLGFDGQQWNNPPASMPMTIATSSIRRKAQWLNRYPHHQIDNLRGNVNTRLRKVAESHWQGAIFAAAGLERIELRPTTAIDLDWMLPAPAQGAILVVCRDEDESSLEACAGLHHQDTSICVGAERDFLRRLMGGCSTPISALARIEGDELLFDGNVLSTDGQQKVSIHLKKPIHEFQGIGTMAAEQLLNEGGAPILTQWQHG